MRISFVAGSGRRPSGGRHLAAIGLTLATALATGPAAMAAGTGKGAASLSSAALAPTLVRADADTYVVRERPGRAYGEATSLVAARRADRYSEILLRFTVPDAGGRTPRRVVLELSTRGSAKPGGLEVRRVSGSWSESTTYADRPSLGGLAGKPVAQSASGVVAFDVTASVTGPGTYAFAVRSTGGRPAVFHSTEAGDRGPRLTVEYADPGDGTGGTGATGGSAGASGGTSGETAAGTLCGASFATESEGETMREALARVDGYYGGLELIRLFNPGEPKPWARMLDVGGRPVHVSFKMNPSQVLQKAYDAKLRQWFADAPRDRVTYWTYHHEPEDNIEKGEFTAAQFRAAFEHIAKIADEVGNPRLKATLTLMGWSFNARSGRTWTDYLPGRSYVDVVAVDVYNQGRNAKQPKYTPPAQLFDGIVAEIGRQGLAFAVAETGSTVIKGDDGTGRAQWLRDLTRYLTQKGALYVAYFDHDWRTKSGDDYRLRDPAGKAAWRDFCDA